MSSQCYVDCYSEYGYVTLHDGECEGYGSYYPGYGNTYYYPGYNFNYMYNYNYMYYFYNKEWEPPVCENSNNGGMYERTYGYGQYYYGGDRENVEDMYVCNYACTNGKEGTWCDSDKDCSCKDTASYQAKCPSYYNTCHSCGDKKDSGTYCTYYDCTKCDKDNYAYLLGFGGDEMPVLPYDETIAKLTVHIMLHGIRASDIGSEEIEALKDAFAQSSSGLVDKASIIEVTLSAASEEGADVPGGSGKPPPPQHGRRAQERKAVTVGYVIEQSLARSGMSEVGIASAIGKTIDDAVKDGRFIDNLEDSYDGYQM
jgi:hypothetical protein